MAQVITDGNHGSSASLIDASEKPLHRAPAARGQEPEEWPVLIPSPAIGHAGLEEKLRESGRELVRQTNSVGQERYPKLGDISKKTTGNDQLPVSRYSEAFQYDFKNDAPLTAPTTRDSNASPVAKVDGEVRSGVTAKPISRLSAGAASVEKSQAEAKTVLEPRQTRTSSLRARLSAGQLVQNNQTKVVGFTDFTSPQAKEFPARKDSYRARKEAQARSSREPLASSKKHDTGKTAPVVSNRPPAQFVGGSRRPVPPRRPGSRGSNYIDHQYANLAPSTQMATRLASSATEPLSDDGPYPPIKRTAQPRKSSIPIPNHITVNSRKSPLHQRNQDMAKHSLATPSKKPREVFEIFRDEPALRTGQPLEYEHEGDFKDNKIEDISELENGLGAIEESPQLCRTKHLSEKAPQYGPRLTISNSAERLIMGGDFDKENMPENREHSKTTSKEHHTPSQFIIGSLRKSVSRPLSSQTILQYSPLIGKSDARDKKTKSMDLSTVFCSTSSPTPASFHPNTSRSTDDSSKESFYESHENPIPSAPNDFETPAVANDTTMIDEAAWIAPLLTEASEIESGADALGETSQPRPLDVATPVSSRPLHQDADLVGRSVGQDVPSKDLFGKEGDKVDPFAESFSPQSPLPPRSSSKTIHPDFTNPSGPVAATKPINSVQAPSKDFVRRQNNLGARKGLASSQLDLSNTSPKRDSTARESNKSSSSVSKTVLSNFRGLFHKRSSDISESAKKPIIKTTTKAKIHSNGSPLPTSSDTHPAHRANPVSSVSRKSTPQSQRPGILAAASPSNLNSPSLASPAPTDVSATTSLAMQVLESARSERSSPRKEQLLEVGKIMVDAITHARDAEKAMEEAKQAARRAEVASALCKGSLRDVSRVVGSWKRN